MMNHFISKHNLLKVIGLFSFCQFKLVKAIKRAVLKFGSTFYNLKLVGEIKISQEKSLMNEFGIANVCPQLGVIIAIT